MVFKTRTRIRVLFIVDSKQARIFDTFKRIYYMVKIDSHQNFPICYYFSSDRLK